MSELIILTTLPAKVVGEYATTEPGSTSLSVKRMALQIWLPIIPSGTRNLPSVATRIPVDNMSVAKINNKNKRRCHIFIIKSFITGQNGRIADCTVSPPTLDISSGNVDCVSVITYQIDAIPMYINPISAISSPNYLIDTVVLEPTF